MNVIWHWFVLMLTVAMLANCNAVEDITGQDDDSSGGGNSQDLQAQSQDSDKKRKTDDDDDAGEDDDDDDDDDDDKVSCDALWKDGLVHDETGITWRKLRDINFNTYARSSSSEKNSLGAPYYFNECREKFGADWQNASGSQLYTAYVDGFFKANNQNKQCAAPVKQAQVPLNSVWCPPNADCAYPPYNYAVSEWLFCVKVPKKECGERCPSGESYFNGECVEKDEYVACQASYNPVCTCDGRTFSNSCYAKLEGYKSWDEGACNGGPIW